MNIIVIYGKGGIGKSTIAANLSVSFANSGRRVLHIGCDPKRDSCRLLTDGKRIPTVLEKELSPNLHSPPAKVIFGTRHGVDCMESGGPPPGVGCGGRGIARTLELIDNRGILTSGDYDMVIYDVLGDVVCGGFAAPLKKSEHRKNVFIVVSEEMMSMYAANNIARAVMNFHKNNVVLGGLIANLRDNGNDLRVLKKFAGAINTSIVHVLERDETNREAEFKCKPIVEYAPDAPLAVNINMLSAKITKVLNRKKLPQPAPMDEEGFYGWSMEQMS